MKWKSKVIMAGILLLCGAVVIATQCVSPQWIVRKLNGGFKPPPWTSDHVIASAAIGDSIIEAAERYRAERGFYPPSVESLTPDYLKMIPTPLVGESVYGENPWMYSFRRDPENPSNTSFELGLSHGLDNLISRSGMMQSLRYESSIGIWTVTRVTFHTRSERTIERWPLNRVAADALAPPPDREIHHVGPSSHPADTGAEDLRF